MRGKSNKLTYIQRISLHNKTEEEKELIFKLFNSNINIAYKIASKYYKTKYWDYEESLQIAKIGLFKACLIWDPTKYKITTLAYNIINRDFIDFDKLQKKQPIVILSLDEEIKTGDQIIVSDIIADTDLTKEKSMEIDDNLKELNNDIVYILDDISDELNLSKGLVKLIYLVYIESNQDDVMGLSKLKFIKKSVVNDVVNLLQIKLKDIMKEM